jgi:mannosyltransferase
MNAQRPANASEPFRGAAFRLGVAGGSALFLLAVAAFASNAVIERALLGTSSGVLSWGASLFRGLLVLHAVVLATAGVVWARGTRDPGLVTPPTTHGDDRSPWLILAGLSVLALALRLWALNSCLWFDEVLTLVDFVRAPLGEIVVRFPSQNQHMLFSLLAHGSVATFGESAWALRLPSVAFGVASLWALFLLGRRLLGVREALLACALMTVSYHHVWFSQNARGYMGLLFFSTLATWLWLEALSRRAWSWHLAYAVTVALGMWTHMTLVFVPAVHALLYAVQLVTQAWTDDRPGALRRALADAVRPVGAWALAGSLTLQLYALSLPEFLHAGLHEVSLETEWTNPLWVIAESLRSLRVGFGPLAVVFCGAFVVAAGWLSLARRSWMAAATLILPPLLGGATMLALGHNLWPRFFFFAMGFAILIAVHGAMTVARLVLAPLPLRNRAAFATAAGTGAVLLMIAASAYSLQRAYALPKQDFTGARDYVEGALQHGDAVVAVGLAGVAYRRYFAPRWNAVDSADELKGVLRSHPRVWLVYTLPVELRAYHPEVWEVVDREFEVVKVFPGTLGDGQVTVCRERNHERLARLGHAQ